MTGNWFSERSKSSSRDGKRSQSSDSSSDSSTDSSSDTGSNSSLSCTKRGRTSRSQKTHSSDDDNSSRSPERTYYSPNYCPWSSGSSSESDSSDFSFRSIYRKSNAHFLISVSSGEHSHIHKSTHIIHVNTPSPTHKTHIHNTTLTHTLVLNVKCSRAD